MIFFIAPCQSFRQYFVISPLVLIKLSLTSVCMPFVWLNHLCNVLSTYTIVHTMYLKFFIKCFFLYHFCFQNALNLGKRRPPLHCTTLPLIILGGCLAVGWFYDSPKVWRFGWLTWVSIFSHHVRDGFRRGIWLWPFGSTPPIPYYLYLVIILALPYLVMIPLKEGDKTSYLKLNTVAFEV